MAYCVPNMALICPEMSLICPNMSSDLGHKDRDDGRDVVQPLFVRLCFLASGKDRVNRHKGRHMLSRASAGEHAQPYTSTHTSSHTHTHTHIPTSTPHDNRFTKTPAWRILSVGTDDCAGTSETEKNRRSWRLTVTLAERRSTSSSLVRMISPQTVDMSWFIYFRASLLGYTT